MDAETCRRSRTYLVEDVILTLANIRAALGWIRGDEVPEAMRDIAFDRIDREIAALEDRAICLRPSLPGPPFLLHDPLPADPLPRARFRGHRAAQRARIAARAGDGG